MTNIALQLLTLSIINGMVVFSAPKMTEQHGNDLVYQSTVAQCVHSSDITAAWTDNQTTVDWQFQLLGSDDQILIDSGLISSKTYTFNICPHKWQVPLTPRVRSCWQDFETEDDDCSEWAYIETPGKQSFNTAVP